MVENLLETSIFFIIIYSIQIYNRLYIDYIKIIFRNEISKTYSLLLLFRTPTNIFD
jgi:hypothetical protein